MGQCLTVCLTVCLMCQCVSSVSVTGKLWPGKHSWVKDEEDINIALPPLPHLSDPPEPVPPAGWSELRILLLPCLS